MKQNYKCKLAKSVIMEEHEEDEVNIHFIFEYKADGGSLKSITNNVLAPTLLSPMDFEGIEFLGKVDESYGVIANNYPVIEVVSNTEFRLVTAGCSLFGDITENDLESCGLGSLNDLENTDFGYDVLFVNDAPLVAKKVVIFISIDAILPGRK
ncbi:hypothetical protein KK120_19525 [Virgibacillus dakarensis]|uniref:hypothetical protein n=1 Tax=Cytobacillus kochii TaxID=859143 RepID=UPI000C81A26F|nr:hypothetical protein [Cytobacillus kochii]MBT2217997.1 hypothetical protein [Virgibacillus dakarensis]MCA1025037.1 hypothetical protein [Cytobacillus kochii]